ncbi:hypothetical protein RCXUPER_236 [Rhodobacter phage RcXuper]|nr:hypothetical protein RCXUPER_236 [Rhodobacter phage RcXuper]
MFTLSSSARVTTVKFASVAEADEFVTWCKPSQETLVLVDATGAMVWEKKFD